MNAHNFSFYIDHFSKNGADKLGGYKSETIESN